MIPFIALRNRCCGFRVGYMHVKNGQRVVYCAFCEKYNGWNAPKGGRDVPDWRLYRIFGRNQILLYIGMTANWSYRIRDHHKKQPWSAEIRQIILSDPYLDEESLIAAERDAIEEERPKYNIVYNRQNTRWDK